jgi:ferredoxin--NADP+ reductase
MSAFHEEEVLTVHHWTERLFSFTTTRDTALRFSNGHFTMIGLRVNDKPLLRAYSIVSPNYEEHLEFLSVIRDPDTYERFDKVVLVHGVREVKELAYHDYLTQALPQHEFLGEMVREKLLYYPMVTREPFKNQGRLTDAIESGKLFADLGLPAFNPTDDRVMICGSPQMLKDAKRMLEARGFKEGNTTQPGDFVIERAFAEQ